MRHATATTPTFRKGDLVRPVPPGYLGWRRATPEERQAWYERLAEDCRAGRDDPWDSGGESKLAPVDTYFTLKPDDTLIITRARVRAPNGWTHAKDCCEVFCPGNGETLFVSRHALTDRW
jgi:hypothetical protein